MATRREDVDLELVLRHPRCAREWVQKYKWDVSPPPRYVVFGIDEKIFFENMTDDQAVRAAFIILRDVEIPQLNREIEYLKGFGIYVDH